MTTKERIGKAQSSHNLSEAASGELSDVDIVRACGMAGATNPLGLSVWRWRVSGDTRELPRIAEALIERGYELGLVGRVLMHLSSDVCTDCLGRGYKVMAGAPILSDEMCLVCGGTGRREMQGDAERDLIEYIARLEREIAAAVMRRLAQDMEF